MRREAGRLVAELTTALGRAPRLRLGGLGVLDVLVDGRTVFSKKAEGRMPRPGEVLARVREAG